VYVKKSSLLLFLSCGQWMSICFIAIIFAAAVGGSSIAGATDFNLKLAEGLVCPDGSRLTYRLGELERIDEVPSEANPIGAPTYARSFSVQCVESGQVVVAAGDGLLITTLALLLSGYFLACFLPLLLVSVAVAAIIRASLKARN
jgi:hypothetical protein